MRLNLLKIHLCINGIYLAIATDIEQFLRPLLSSQLIFRISNASSSDPLISRSVIFLSRHNAPLQLFAMPDSKLPRRHSAVYADHRITWIFFMKNEFEDQVSLDVTLREALLYHGESGFKGWYVNIHTDIMFFLFDITETKWRVQYEPITLKCLIPSNLLLVEYEDGVIHPPKFHLGGCDSCITDLEDYFKIAAKGTESITRSLTNIRRDFHGTTVTFFAEYRIHQSWSMWLKSLENKNISNLEVPLARFYSLFAQAHNLSIDTVPLNYSVPWKLLCNKCVVHTRKMYFKQSWKEATILPPLSLTEFESFRTFYSTEILFDYGIIVHSWPVFAVFLTLILCVLMVAMTILDTCNIVQVSMFVIYGPIGQASGNQSMLKKLTFWYTGWLLTAGVIISVYTNTLQSLAIAPTTASNIIPFKEMIESNYSLYSHDFFINWMKSIDLKTLRLHTKETHSLNFKNEEKLLELLKPMPKLNGSAARQFYLQEKSIFILNPFIESFARLICNGQGREFVAGTEQLFNFPTWWSFEHTTNGDLLLKTLRVITETGLFQYLSSWADGNHVREWAEFSGLQLEKSKEKPASVSIDLLSSIVPGYLSGMTMAVMAFIAELISCRVSVWLWMKVKMHFKSISAMYYY